MGEQDPSAGSGQGVGEREEGGAMAALKRAAEKMVEEYPGVSLVGMVFCQGAIYIAAAGGGGVWVKDGEREGWLIRAGEQESERAGVKTMSGWAKEGMTLVLGNFRFWEGLPVGVMRAILGAGESGPDEAAEGMGTVLFGRGKSEGEVGAVIKVSKAQDLVVDEEERPEEEVEVPEIQAAEKKKET